MINKIQRALAIVSVLSTATAQAQESGYDCVIDPASTVKIASPVRGILDEVLVERGDTVRKGQVLARMESSVEASNVALNRIRAEDTALVDVEIEELNLRELTLDRAATLGQTNAVSQQELDELTAEYHIQERELARARMEQKLAEVELSRSEAMLAMRTIRSPSDGVIIERNLSAGEFVQEDGHIVTLVELDPLFVETFVPVDRYAAIVNGQVASVEPAAPFSGQFPATVTVVDPVFDPASSTFGVRLELANPDHRLPGGLRCRVYFEEQSADGAAANVQPND